MRTEDDTASSLSRSSTNGPHARINTIDISEYRTAKRRKVAGLNTRFDRMIKSVNTMLSYSSPASSRKRMRSSGTSSVSSHDIPKTPVDAYSNLYPGKLGEDFSLLKMKNSLLVPRNDSDGFPKPAAPLKEPRDPLPDWLADTFCNLEADHPLRGLLPSSRIYTESAAKLDSPSIELLGTSPEEEVFAFSPFDKLVEAPDTAYHTDNARNVQQCISPVVPTEPTLSHLQLEASSTDPLPFSTPGCFAPVRGKTQKTVVDTTFQIYPVPEPQQTTPHAASTMHPSAPPLRRGDVTGQPRIIWESSNLVQDNGLPSDLQDHGLNTNQHHQGLRRGRNDLTMYATPGPTFVCSRPVYFDSPAEDPSLSDPLQPESYELDLNAIDFRWRPFLRWNVPESDMNTRPVSPSFPLARGITNQVTMGDQNGWNSRFIVDKVDHGASSEDLPSLSEDLDFAYLDDIRRPGTVSMTPNMSSAVHNAAAPWPSQINDVQQARPAFPSPGGFLPPLRDHNEASFLAAVHVLPRGDGENILRASEERPLPYGEDVETTGSAVHEIRPSTPIRQAAVSPPSTPHKFRSSQLCEIPRVPARKTSSALPWMIPLRPSKRTVPVRHDVDRHLSCTSANSHDSIESWSEPS